MLPSGRLKLFRKSSYGTAQAAFELNWGGHRLA
jgi:hypothetical protein